MLIRQQIETWSKVNITPNDNDDESFLVNYHGNTIRTTSSSCSCYFQRSMRLPCKHIFAVRSQLDLPLFDACRRWSSSYIKRIRESLDMTVQIHVVSLVLMFIELSQKRKKFILK